MMISYSKEKFETIKELRIFNKYKNIESFRIRIGDGANDPDAFEFSEGTSQTFEVINPIYTCNIRYQGHILQQFDFNNNKISDDMNMPNSGSKFNVNNTITYKPDNSGHKTLVDFDKYTCSTIFDNDGIDGNGQAKIESALYEDPFTGTVFIGIKISGNNS